MLSKWGNPISLFLVRQAGEGKEQRTAQEGRSHARKLSRNPANHSRALSMSAAHPSHLPCFSPGDPWAPPSMVDSRSAVAQFALLHGLSVHPPMGLVVAVCGSPGAGRL